MARLPRLTLPGYPHHIILRGNNRQPIFNSEADRRRLLDLLSEYSRKFQVAIHAYVLMENHFHLLATPNSSTGVAQMMQAIGRSYVRYFNASYQRSGTLFEGRYRSTVIQADRYLLSCMAYIDLNPVRAGTVANASDFPWSSHGHYIGQHLDKLISPHALLWGIGNTPFAREQSYAEMVNAAASESLFKALTDATLQGWVLGDESFIAGLQLQTERRLVKQKAGRPPQKTLQTPAK